MKIVFGQVPEKYKDESEVMFHGTTSDGKTGNYYFMLEVNDEPGAEGTFSFIDTCDRYMPFDFENLDELSEVVNTLKEYRDDKVKFSKHWKSRFGFK